jgi:hypothetical protein
MHPAFSRAQIVERTHVLVRQLLSAETTQSKLHRTDELNRHLMSFPASRMVAVEVVPVFVVFKNLIMINLGCAHPSSIKAAQRDDPKQFCRRT